VRARLELPSGHMNRKPFSRRTVLKDAPGSDRSQAAVLPAHDNRVVDPIRRISSCLLIALVFIVWSRLPEFVAYHVANIVKVVLSLVMMAMIVTAGWRRALSSRISILMILFTLWLVLATAFSTWKGGSADLLATTWSVSLAVCLSIVGLTVTFEQCRRVMAAVGFGTLFMGLALLRGGEEHMGRLQLTHGTLQNPNDVAFLTILGLPALLFLAVHSRRVSIQFWVALAGILFCTLAAVRTGSRMGLVMLAVLWSAGFVASSMRQKIALVFATLLLGGAAIGLTDKASLQRYYSMISGGADTDDLNEEEQTQVTRAMGSTTARTELLLESLRFTWRHPVFGVGPGMFGLAASEAGQEERSLAWRQTHNTYTQISSEAGLPALAAYLGALASAFVVPLRCYRRFRGDPSQRELASLSYWTLVAVLTFAVGAFFGSFAYGYIFPVLGGLAAAVGLCAADVMPSTAAPHFDRLGSL
jgi:putative inorganic carbon (hco3(-)) transporter